MATALDAAAAPMASAWCRCCSTSPGPTPADSSTACALGGRVAGAARRRGAACACGASSTRSSRPSAAIPASRMWDLWNEPDWMIAPWRPPSRRLSPRRLRQCLSELAPARALARHATPHRRPRQRARPAALSRPVARRAAGALVRPSRTSRPAVTARPCLVERRTTRARRVPHARQRPRARRDRRRWPATPATPPRGRGRCRPTIAAPIAPRRCRPSPPSATIATRKHCAHVRASVIAHAMQHAHRRTPAAPCLALRRRRWLDRPCRAHRVP